MFDARVKRFFRLRDKKNHARLYYFLIVLICHAKVYWLWVAVRLDWSAVTTKILTFYFPLLLGGGASQIINFMAPIRFEYSIHGFHVYIYRLLFEVRGFGVTQWSTRHAEEKATTYPGMKPINAARVAVTRLAPLVTLAEVAHRRRIEW